MKTRVIAALMLTLTLIVTACSGGDASNEADFETVDVGVAAEEPAMDASDDMAREAIGEESELTQDVSDAGSVNRVVIRTAWIDIVASDTRATMDEITSMVETSGGYVSSSSVNPTGQGEEPYITMTVRVPADGLGTALAAIRGLADDVISESTDSTDVTEEYVDIESRLRNLDALETELVALLAEVRQQPEADPSKLLEVYNEISNVRGQIEVLEGRKRLIENQASLSTITVSITPPAIDAPIVDEGWQPLLTIKRAAGDLVDTLQNLGDVALWFLVYAVPVLLLIGIPVWLVVRYARRRADRRQTQTPPPPPPAPAEAQPQEEPTS